MDWHLTELYVRSILKVDHRVSLDERRPEVAGARVQTDKGRARAALVRPNHASPRTGPNRRRNRLAESPGVARMRVRLPRPRTGEGHCSSAQTSSTACAAVCS